MKKPNDLFQHVDAIFTNQRIDYFDNLSDESKKAYNGFMVNRAISMNSDFLPLVNEINQYQGNIGSRESYLFYSQALPHKKQFNKWIKSETAREYDSNAIRLLIHHNECSIRDAEVMYDIYMQHPNQFKIFLESYGMNPKDIKKVI